MEMRPGVTIAIPNWNHECMLARSILSGLRTLDVLRMEDTKMNYGG